MISAQEFYEQVKELRERLYTSQLKYCEYKIYEAINNPDYLLLTGRVSLLLGQYPVPRLIQELEDLGYVDIQTVRCGRGWQLSFSVPQLASKEDSTSDTDAL